MIKNNRCLGALLVSTVGLMIGGIDIYLPTFPHLVEFFNTTPEFIQFTLTLSPLVSAFFSFMWGRKANFYSHKSLMLLALILFGSGSLICSFATLDFVFLGGRFVQAVGGSGLSILTVVLLYDLFDDEKDQARYMALYGAMFPAVFAVAPIIGAQLFVYFGWQSCFLFVFFVTVIFYALYSTLLPNVKHVQSDPDGASALKQVKNLLTDKRYMTFVFGHSLPIAISMLFTTNSAFLFQTYFCFSPVVYSFVQCIPVLLNFIGAFYYRHLLKKISVDRSLTIGGMSLLFFVVALSILIYTPVPISPLTLIITMSVFTFYISFSLSSSFTKAVDTNVADRGMAIGTISSARNFIGSFFVISCAQFYDGTPHPMLITMLGTAILLTWLLLVYAPRFYKN